jgi:hypothetical protein
MQPTQFEAVKEDSQKTYQEVFATAQAWKKYSDGVDKSKTTEVERTQLGEVSKLASKYFYAMPTTNQRWMAKAKGNKDVIQALIYYGVSQREPGYLAVTALIANPRTLVEAEKDKQGAEKGGGTALMELVMLEVVKNTKIEGILLDAGTDVVVGYYQKMGFTGDPLNMKLSRADAIKYLKTHNRLIAPDDLQATRNQIK